jgi:hypothetical protein
MTALPNRDGNHAERGTTKLLNATVHSFWEAAEDPDETRQKRLRVA